jgi:hypothetical protein
MTETGIYVILIVIGLVLAFTVVRLLVLWYFQIDKRVNQNTAIINELREIKTLLQKQLQSPDKVDE